MSERTIDVPPKLPSPETVNRVALQRQCACGAHSAGGADCAECSKKPFGLPRGLALGAVDDPREAEADRAAERAIAPPSFAAGRAIPRSHRSVEPAAAALAAVPASIGRVLASSGSPLEPALRRDMEGRFGHDFSRVRVHSNAVAATSAQDVDASAYTVGHHMVFGAGRFAPATPAGRRLIAHELTHVTQQGGEQRVVQRAPVNYPSNEPVGPTGPTPDPTAQKSTLQPTPDDLIGMLVSFRVNSSPRRVAQFLAANESTLYPLLSPYGFRGSWTSDQGYLDDFDAAIHRWSRSHRYQFASAAVRHPVARERPKSREERQYDTAKFLIADMNRHGYTRGKVNDELESSGLMDDLVSHGFERHAARSFKNHVEYQNEAIAALVDYVDRYDAAHGIKHQASVNVPTQGEDIEFYHAWLEGLGYVTSSFFAAAAAATASKFTSDPKKITAAAGLGAAFEGVVFSVAGAKPGSYRPEVVKAPDRPAAVGTWRYERTQPVKAAVDPARVAAPPARDPIPPPEPVVDAPAVQAPVKAPPPKAPTAPPPASDIEQAEQRYNRLREKASQAERDYAKSLRNTVRAKEQRADVPTEQEGNLLETKRALEKARDDALAKLKQLRQEQAGQAQPAAQSPGQQGLAQEPKYLEELRARGLSARLTDKSTPVIDAAILGTPEVHSVKSVVSGAGTEAAVRSASSGSPRDLADRVSAKITEALIDRRSDKWTRLRNQWNTTKRSTYADQFGYELPKNPDDINFVVDVRILGAEAPSPGGQQAVEAAVTTWLKKNERVPPRFSWRIVYVGK